MTLEEIAEATWNDRTLRALRAAWKTGYWNIDCLKPYQQITDEITLDHIHRVFLRGTRLILPASLQDRVIKLAHQGHQGNSKTTALLREYLWFPNLGKLAKSEIEGCLALQAVAQPNPTKPPRSTTMPSHFVGICKSWFLWSVSFRSLHFCCYWLLFVISRSRILKSISAMKVIPKLDTIFAHHGIPVKPASDKGSSFQSEELKCYRQQPGMKHHHSTSFWPQGNTEVQAFNKPLEKAIVEESSFRWYHKHSLCHVQWALVLVLVLV